MAVSLELKLHATAVETFTSDASLAANDKGVTHSGFNISKSLSASTTPPATKTAYFSQAMTDGAATIDLTGLPGTNAGVVSLSGLKVQSLLLENPSTNANAISIEPGASNGYDIFGSDFKVTLQPGQSALFYGNDATPDVGSSDKTLDIAGTGTQSLKVGIVAG